MDQIVTEKLCRKCNIVKSISDFHKCSRNKTGVQSKCKICMNAYYMKHQEKLIKRTRDWEQDNKERKNARQKEWIKNNKEKRSIVIKRYYDNNKEKCKIARTNWENKNPGIKLIYRAKRRAISKKATPVWADINKIKNIYKEAAQMREQGIDVHVDHIIPLKNNLVCGLHVHNNLRIVNAVENLQKSNKYVIE